GIGDPRLESAFLFLVADFEPEFDEDDAAIHDIFLRLRAAFQEQPVLFLGAEAHHVFHPGAVVPTAIEDNHFTRRGEMRHESLHVHLRLLAVRRSGQRNNAKNPWADPLGDGADRAALARAIAPLEY